jgi:hypothetical protein
MTKKSAPSEVTSRGSTKRRQHRRLTERQRKLIRNLSEGMNITDAAHAARYTRHRAGSVGHKISRVLASSRVRYHSERSNAAGRRSV